MFCLIHVRVSMCLPLGMLHARMQHDMGAIVLIKGGSNRQQAAARVAVDCGAQRCARCARVLLALLCAGMRCTCRLRLARPSTA